MTGIRWKSLATVVAGGAVFLVCLVAVVLGHPWSAVPGGLGLLLAVREVRYLRRLHSGKFRPPGTSSPGPGRTR